MIKHKNIYGVDISKDYFDVVCSDGSHNQFLNDDSGFAAFKNEMARSPLVVMESTGYYHHRLAQFLTKEKVKVAVVNPISVKRFSQMKLSKIKTDCLVLK